jgi:hypothetical protein
LTLDYLTFDSNGIHHHGLTYTTLSCVRKKENLFLFTPLIYANFKVDKCVSNKMQWLKTTIQWHLCISSLQPFRKTHTITQYLNTKSLSLHFENIEIDHNLQTSRILCLNKTRVTMQHYTSHPYANYPKDTSIEIYGN